MKSIFFDNFEVKVAASAFKFRPKTDITTGIHVYYMPQKQRTARTCNARYIRILGREYKKNLLWYCTHSLPDPDWYCENFMAHCRCIAVECPGYKFFAGFFVHVLLRDNVLHPI